MAETGIPPAERPRWVLLFHAAGPGLGRPDHWDLLIEQDGVLLGWAAAGNPFSDERSTAAELPPHRLFYLDHEGPLSMERGEVRRRMHGSVLAADREGPALQFLLGDGSGSGISWRVRIEPGDGPPQSPQTTARRVWITVAVHRQD